MADYEVGIGTGYSFAVLGVLEVITRKGLLYFLGEGDAVLAVVQASVVMYAHKVEHAHTIN